MVKVILEIMRAGNFGYNCEPDSSTGEISFGVNRANRIKVLWHDYERAAAILAAEEALLDPETPIDFVLAIKTAIIFRNDPPTAS